MGHVVVGSSYRSHRKVGSFWTIHVAQLLAACAQKQIDTLFLSNMIAISVGYPAFRSPLAPCLRDSTWTQHFPEVANLMPRMMSPTTNKFVLSKTKLKKVDFLIKNLQVSTEPSSSFEVGRYYCKSTTMAQNDKRKYGSRHGAWHKWNRSIVTQSVRKKQR